MDLTKTHGMDDGHGLMIQNQAYGTDMDSWYRHGLMVKTWTHDIDMDSWYWQRLIVWTAPMVLT